MKYLSFATHALLYALIIVTIGISSGLTAHVNMAALFLISWLLLFAAFSWARRTCARGFSAEATLWAADAWLLCALVAVGPASVLSAPASSIAAGLSGLHTTAHAASGAAPAASALAAVLAALIVAGIAASVIAATRNPAPEPVLDPDEAALRRTSRLARRITLALISILVALCASVPALRASTQKAFLLLTSGDIDAVAAMIGSYGHAAALVSAALMVLQSLAAPIPAFLITFANAAVFGWWQGALLSWASSMAGASLCFAIARMLGRDAVAHFVSRGALAQVDSFFERYGKNAILICRLLPFVSFDYVSYAAGLTGMSFSGFFWATGIGQLPATIVYSYVGGMLSGGAQLMMVALMITFALFAAAYLLKQVYNRRHAQG